MPAHAVTHDGLAIHIDRKLFGDQCWQFLRDIGPHLVMSCKRWLYRINIEASAEAKFISAIWILLDALASRRCVRRDENDAQFRL